MNYLIWIFVYFFIHFLLSSFSVAHDSLMTIIVYLIYWTVFSWNLKKKDLLSEYGICSPSFAGNHSTFILLIIPIFQFLVFEFPQITAVEAIVILFAAFAEEMAFRVLLPKLMTAQMHFSIIGSVIISSGVFSLFHIINLFSGTSHTDVMLQMLFAFCSGCAFSAVKIMTRSVFPSVILHTMINCTAANYIDSIVVISTISFSFLQLGYALNIFYKKRRGFDINETLY